MLIYRFDNQTSVEATNLKDAVQLYKEKWAIVEQLDGKPFLPTCTRCGNTSWYGRNGRNCGEPFPKHLNLGEINFHTGVGKCAICNHVQNVRPPHWISDNETIN